jgi:mRNA interferase MazF
MDLKQYQLILVNLDPTVGHEIRKTRPCVIISPNEMNFFLATLVIAPITSSHKDYPTRIQVKHGDKTGWVVIDQVRTIDKQRVVKILGKLTEPEIKKIKHIIKETFVD